MSSFTLVVAVVLIFVGIFGGIAVLILNNGKGADKGRLQEQLAGYSIAPPQTSQQAVISNPTALGTTKVTRSTVGIADRVVKDRGFEEKLADSLEAANVKLRPGEWMVLHIACTIGLGVIMTLLGSFGIIAGILGMGLGFALPYGYLSVKRGKRQKAFYQALPDTLSMISGSLSAGHSLPQALDATAQETSGPMSDELGRALVATRLGANLEDALDEIAVRMESTDMAWVVMAIRIQREVGGNLAEVLMTVSGTLRERERLRRQVQSLSAEGKLSAYILGALPILIGLYMSVVRPEYIEVLFTHFLGLVMLGFGSAIFIAGCFWMRSVVTVKV